MDKANPLPVWKKSACNPVLVADAIEGGVLVRDGAVLHEDDEFSMWYWGTSGVYFATSADGMSWLKHGEVMPEYGRPSVTRKGDTYYVYVNDETQIRLFTSKEPMGRYTDMGQVMVPTEPFEEGRIKSPWVLWDPDEDLFKMWYTAGEIRPLAVSWTEPKVAGYATSLDGVIWTKRPAPVLTAEQDDGWRHLAVMTLHPTKYLGRYYALASYGDSAGVSRIGFIESTNGVDWDTSDATPAIDVGNPGDWDQSDCYTGTVLNINGFWRMWYNARNASDSNRESIGIAELV